MSLKEILSQDPEIAPKWLSGDFLKATSDIGDRYEDRCFLKDRDHHRILPKFPLKKVLGSRVLFYPGSGVDTHPINLFVGASSIHCFIYADCAQKKEKIVRWFNGRAEVDESCERGYDIVKGYKPLFIIEGDESEFFPHGYQRHSHQTGSACVDSEFRWGLWAVLQRSPLYDVDSLRPDRILVCYLSCEGVSAFASLWPKKTIRRVPYAIMLDAYGMGGGNAEWASAESPLAQIANTRRTLPQWLFVGPYVQPWPEYASSEGTEYGGMWNHPRTLFKRIKKSDI